MRQLRSVLVGVIVCIGFAAPAAAQDWGRGWLERLSGPGPFEGEDLGVTAACLSSQDKLAPLWNPQRPDRRDRSTLTRFCLDLEYSNYTNEQDDRLRHGFIAFERYIALAAFQPQQLKGIVEFAAGFGMVSFRGDTFDFTRTVIPVRATLKPLRLAGCESKCDWKGIPQIVYTGNIFPEAIRNTDFNITDQTFEDYYLQPKFGITLRVDFSAVVFHR